MRKRKTIHQIQQSTKKTENRYMNRVCHKKEGTEDVDVCEVQVKTTIHTKTRTHSMQIQSRGAGIVCIFHSFILSPPLRGLGLLAGHAVDDAVAAGVHLAEHIAGGQESQDEGNADPEPDVDHDGVVGVDVADAVHDQVALLALEADLGPRAVLHIRRCAIAGVEGALAGRAGDVLLAIGGLGAAGRRVKGRAALVLVAEALVRITLVGRRVRGGADASQIAASDVVSSSSSRGSRDLAGRQGAAVDDDAVRVGLGEAGGDGLDGSLEQVVEREHAVLRRGHVRGGGRPGRDDHRGKEGAARGHTLRHKDHGSQLAHKGRHGR
eukprot:m.35145 g.35145  ORF g.35145 m.35145 type:complete len:323 (-) comp11251_c0_seq1:844-1812(-)